VIFEKKYIKVDKKLIMSPGEVKVLVPPANRRGEERGRRKIRSMKRSRCEGKLIENYPSAT
jgi:hypothetical protein